MTRSIYLSLLGTGAARDEMCEHWSLFWVEDNEQTWVIDYRGNVLGERYTKESESFTDPAIALLSLSQDAADELILLARHAKDRAQWNKLVEAWLARRPVLDMLKAACGITA